MLLIASSAANWLSQWGQGCTPLSISSTVQPSDQMSALRPAQVGGREGGREGVPCLYGWSRETNNTYHDCYRHHHHQQQQQQC